MFLIGSPQQWSSGCGLGNWWEMQIHRLQPHLLKQRLSSTASKLWFHKLSRWFHYILKLKNHWARRSGIFLVLFETWKANGEFLSCSFFEWVNPVAKNTHQWRALDKNNGGSSSLGFSSWQFGKQTTSRRQEDCRGKVHLFNFQKNELLKVVKNCHRDLCQMLTSNSGGLEDQWVA